MNPAHLHRLLNHVPVLGVGFGLAVLGWATFRPRPEFARLALVVFVVSALAAIPTYLSGEPAEDAIEGVAGAIDSASLGSWGSGAHDVPSLSRPMMMASLALALATAGSLAYTANLGGLIRHTEIRSGAPLLGDAGGATGAEHGEQ